MLSNKQILLVIGMLALLVFGCKPKVLPVPENRTVVAPHFFVEAGETDSLLLERFLKHQNAQAFQNDSIRPYYRARIFRPKNGALKIINLFGEHSGGATYTSFAETHLINNQNEVRYIAPGETFRIDSLAANRYLFYLDDFGKSSSFRFYEVFTGGDTLTISPTDRHSNFVFDLINTKKETPDDLPNTQNHQQDKGTKAMGDYTYDSDQQFLSRNLSDLQCTIAIIHKYGDELQKILRIREGDTVREISLAMRGGDSDYYGLSSEFVNDSLFVQTLVNRETIIDANDAMGYAFDSTESHFRYNEKLEFKAIKKERFSYQQHYKITDNRRTESKTVFFSPAFTINGLQVFWETSVTYFDTGRKLRKLTNFNRVLRNAVTRQAILTLQPDATTNEIDGFATLMTDFKDINFDGFLDFHTPNFLSSGASHSFYDTYIFNRRTKRFEYSKSLSGSEIALDQKSKTATLYYRNGSFENTATHHFAKDGTIDYTESYTKEYLVDKKTNEPYYKNTYTKTRNGKIIWQKTAREKWKN